MQHAFPFSNPFLPILSISIFLCCKSTNANAFFVKIRCTCFYCAQKSDVKHCFQTKWIAAQKCCSLTIVSVTWLHLIFSQKWNLAKQIFVLIVLERVFIHHLSIVRRRFTLTRFFLLQNRNNLRKNRLEPFTYPIVKRNEFLNSILFGLEDASHSREKDEECKLTLKELYQHLFRRSQFSVRLFNDVVEWRKLALIQSTSMKSTLKLIQFHKKKKSYKHINVAHKCTRVLSISIAIQFNAYNRLVEAKELNAK